jgi:hypothetical protein
MVSPFYNARITRSPQWCFKIALRRSVLRFDIDEPRYPTSILTLFYFLFFYLLSLPHLQIDASWAPASSSEEFERRSNGHCSPRIVLR